MKEKALAFVTGTISGLLTGIGKEIFMTLLLGIVGGIGGLIGKEIYNYIKRRYGRN